MAFPSGRTYICRACKRELRIAEVTQALSSIELCPQCHTKKIPKTNSRKERAKQCIKACEGIDNLNIVKEAPAMLEELKRLCNVCSAHIRIKRKEICLSCKTAEIINRIEGGK